MQQTPSTNHFLRSGLINADQLRVAQKESQLRGLGLEQALLASGFISEAVLRDFHSQINGKLVIEKAALRADAAVLQLIPASLARQYLLLPLGFDKAGNTLRLAMEKAHDVVALDSISALFERAPQFDIRLASRGDLIEAIDRHYGSEVSIDSLLNSLDTDAANGNATVTDLQSGITIQLVEVLLADAVRCAASDLHFEPERGFLRIRYRIDGVLREIRCLHKHDWSPLLVRLKIMSGMNIAETRAAQDGRFTQVVMGRDLDFRVSCFPTVHGENLVIRMLDRSARLLDVKQLGLPEEVLQRMRRIVCKPAGLIIVCGPTGSGKSTTLYSLLNEIRTESINIVTMEDPVEYSIPLLRQCSVNPTIKLDFASGIRALLRQDPDVILVGETRDKATAGMLLRAALTGHLVLTTLHSQTALGALSRLDDLGLNLSHLADSILALVSQRLVRKLCPECKQPVPPPACLLEYVAEGHQCYQAVGCRACHATGYQGRQVVMEFYQPSAKVQSMLASRNSIGTVLEQAESEQHRTLAEQALEYLFDGTTSWQELNRVVDLDPLLVNL